MPLMEPSDWLEMENDLTDVREDNEVSIAIRRGTATLPAQKVRIAGLGGGANSQGQAGEVAAGSVTILGAKTFNVKVGDRFTSDSILYEVNYVEVNRRAAKMATARAVQ